MQVRLADVVERAVDPALEQREVTFDCVGMREAPELDVFLSRMIDARMPGVFAGDRRIDGTTVRHQVRLAIRVLDQDRPQVRGRNVGDVKALGASVALD